jgi:hypothetical protein
MIKTMTRPRSNRPLTQFAVNNLIKFIKSSDPEVFTKEEGNTTVSIHKDKRTGKFTFQVFLFQASIFELDEECITVRNGGFFDSTGRPTRTTRERLNGLLDAAGGLGVIPKGVRVFLTEEECLIGSGSNTSPFQDGIPDRIIVRKKVELLML